MAYILIIILLYISVNFVVFKMTIIHNTATIVSMYEQATKLINDARKIIVIQAENPDGDSVGSAVALEEILSDLGKEVTLYCPVDIPKYLRYIKGWDRVVTDFDTHADLAIIVDTAADVLISKVLETPGVRHFLKHTQCS